MLTCIVLEKRDFAGRTLRYYVSRPQYLFQFGDLFLQFVELAPLGVVSGAPLSLTQGTKLKPAVVTPHSSLLLHHCCIRRISGTTIGTVDHFHLNFYQLRVVLMEGMRLHKLLQDISVYWSWTLHALNRAFDHCIRVRFSLVSDAILVKGVVASERDILISANEGLTDRALNCFVVP